MIKKYEFWNPRIFEAPYYLYLLVRCLLNGITPLTLAKADFCLDHGEIGIGSKLHTQMAFEQDRFLPSTLIDDGLSVDEKKNIIREFTNQHGYPVILKSDVGCVGKGICKLSKPEDVEEKAPLLLGPFIVQKYTPLAYECGIFYVRHKGKPAITAINKKHFPTVIGNGVDTLLTLAQNHERFSEHWNSFLQYQDLDQILEQGEEKRLSFIGSHTLGCKFTDDTYLLTPELERAVFSIFENQPGFNFGRVDVKTENEASLKRGEFVVIEVNGVASLPTNMFDPKFSIWQAYKIFMEHGRYLVDIALEQKHQPMKLLPYKEIIKRVKKNQQMLNRVHDRLIAK